MKESIFRCMLFILVFSGCEKIHYYPDKPIENVKTRFLAHQGGGNSGFQANTLEAVKYGLYRLDGIEVDIQISKNRTIWLSHNAVLPECNNMVLPCLPEVYDNEMVNLDSCLGNKYTFTRLEEVFRYMKDNFPEKYISLDVKPWDPCKLSSLEITGILNVLAGEVVRLSDLYQLDENIEVESEVATFLSYLKKISHNRIACYLTTMGDFERGMQLALKEGYTGLSFKYNFNEQITINHISLLHKKGIRIQLWTLNDEIELSGAILLNPDFIQTDNIDYAAGIQINE